MKINAKRQAHLSELLAYDTKYRNMGALFAGVDEAGRGPLAGSVYAACVVMPENPVILWMDDSKKLSQKRREQVFEEIMEIALFVGVGRASVQEIDRYNILKATRLAMRRAAEGCPATRFLIDAVKDVGLAGEEISVIKGDATSYSIAAASVIAKVSRDREMLTLHALYPQYAFASNKGYGTAAHIAALKEYGPTPQHRQSFIGNFV